MTSETSAAFLWSELSEELRDKIKATGAVADAGKNKEPLILVIAPDQPPWSATGCRSVYDCLTNAYECCDQIDNTPYKGWRVKVLFDRANLSIGSF